ncbi:MAG: type II secretion system F family protein, partial [Oscillospiraceae bacterium]
WRVVSESGNRKLYREMQNAVHNMDNGYSDIQAFEEFAEACKINEIKKFVSIICQNIEKGSSELVHIMKELSIEAWTTKKNVARARGASASTKLILPIMISFAGIIIMIIVPIMMGMSM